MTNVYDNLSALVRALAFVFMASQPCLVAAAPMFIWETPVVNVWSAVRVGTGGGTFTQNFQQGGRDAPVSVRIEGTETVFASGRAKLLEERTQQSGVFTERALAAAGYKPTTPVGEAPEPWVLGQDWHSFAGITLRQGFMVRDAASPGIVAGRADAWGTGGQLTTQFVNNFTLRENWSEGILMWDIRVPALPGFEAWTGLLQAQIRQNPADLLRAVEEAFRTLRQTLLGADAPSDMVDSTVAAIETIQAAILLPSTEGDEGRASGPKPYSPDAVSYVTDQRYELQFDVIAEAGLLNGAWALVDAFNTFNAGFWIGNAPVDDPTLSEPSTLPLMCGALVLGWWIYFRASQVRRPARPRTAGGIRRHLRT